MQPSKLIGIYCLLTLSSTALAANTILSAQDLEHKQNRFDSSHLTPNGLLDVSLGQPKHHKKHSSHTSQPSNASKKIIQISMGEMINRAILYGRWDWVERYLPIYKQSADADPTLIAYAQAGLYVNKGKPANALPYYQAILNARPDLRFVRYRYAQALFSDRQYKEAQEQFQNIPHHGTSAETNHIIDEYLEAIKNRLGFHASFNGNFVKTQNANNASAWQYLQIGGLTFEKNKDSLPKPAIGFHGELDLSYLQSIHSNHYINYDLDIDYLHYFGKASQYDQASIQPSINYIYQNAKYTVSVGSYLERNWFAKEIYSQGYGLMADYAYRWNKHWKSRVNYNYENLVYKTASSYTGHTNTITLTQIYQQPQFSAYLGIGIARRDARAINSSANRRFIYTGIDYTFNQYIGLTAGINWSQWRYDGRDDFFERQRIDTTIGTIVGIYSPKLSLWGFTPKLVWQKRTVKSTIPELYKQRDNRVYITARKAF